jgi:hypothetical protein
MANFSFSFMEIMLRHLLLITGRPLWWEDGPIIYSCAWTSPAQSFSGLNTTGLTTIFHSFNHGSPQNWRARFLYLFLRSVRRLLVTANVPSSPILVTLMMEALIYSETSVLTRAARRNIPEDWILHSHRRENVKSYIPLADWTLKRRSNMSPVK